jgi:hypothetical protein
VPVTSSERTQNLFHLVVIHALTLKTELHAVWHAFAVSNGHQIKFKLLHFLTMAFERVKKPWLLSRTYPNFPIRRWIRSKVPKLWIHCFLRSKKRRVVMNVSAEHDVSIFRFEDHPEDGSRRFLRNAVNYLASHSKTCMSTSKNLEQDCSRILNTKQSWHLLHSVGQSKPKP